MIILTMVGYNLVSYVDACRPQPNVVCNRRELERHDGDSGSVRVGAASVGRGGRRGAFAAGVSSTLPNFQSVVSVHATVHPSELWPESSARRMTLRFVKTEMKWRICWVSNLGQAILVLPVGVVNLAH